MKELDKRICSACGQEYKLTDKQKNEVIAAAKRHTPNFILNCPLCHSLDFVHPAEMLGIEEPHQEIEQTDSRLFCCPVEGCIGFVEEDEDVKGLYGCSECGTEWKSINAIYRDIEKIISKYPYREEVYKKSGNAFKSVPFDKIPKGYYSKVQKEDV